MHMPLRMHMPTRHARARLTADSPARQASIDARADDIAAERNVQM